MGKSLSIREFEALRDYINKYHGFVRGKSPHVKYIRSNFDTRDGKIFSVVLDDQVFSITNENRDKNLLDWICKHLGTTPGEVMMGSVKQDIKFAKGVTTTTLIGIDRTGPYPLKTGNCFSVMTEKNEEYRIVNFNHENYREMLKRGIELPIRILPLSDKVAIVHDYRIPNDWYDEKWCEVCCPDHLLPINQRMKIRREYEGGIRIATESDNGIIIVHHDLKKCPDLRTEAEKQKVKEAYEKVRKFKFVEGPPIIAMSDEVAKDFHSNTEIPGNEDWED